MFRGQVLFVGVGVYRHPLNEVTLLDHSHFCVSLEIEFGVQGTTYTELVTAFVCSPSWLESAVGETDVIRCGEIIVMREYDPARLSRALDNFAKSCLAPTVKAVFAKLARIGYSEYTDFNEAAALRQYLNAQPSSRLISIQQIDADGKVKR